MHDLMAQISNQLAISPERTEKAVGMVLNLIQTQGNGSVVAELFSKLDGAEALATRSGSGSGLMGKMAGGMMGGPLAAIAKMQSLGISMEQNKIITAHVLDHARRVAGDALVRSAASNIPGLSGYL